MADQEAVEAQDPANPEDLTDEEILETFDRFRVSQPIQIPNEMLDPNYEYRWINRRKPNVLTRRKGVGWTPVKKDELEDLVVEGHTVEDLNLGTHVTSDGVIAISDDLIFAKIPKRYADAYRKRHEKRTQEQINAGRRRFHQAGEMLGVETEERR